MILEIFPKLSGSMIPGCGCRILCRMGRAGGALSGLEGGSELSLWVGHITLGHYFALDPCMKFQLLPEEAVCAHPGL